MFLITCLVILGTTAWLADDANQRDWSRNSFADRPWKWIVGALLFWIFVFPLYLVQRNRPN